MSPMNKQQRINSISAMTKHRTQKIEDLKFNNSSKFKLKYLLDKQKSEVFDLILDKESHQVVKVPKDKFIQASEALNSYFFS